MLEALVGVAIAAAGVVAIMAVFPSTLGSAEKAELQTIGAALAMMKIEEIRRDNDEGGRLLNQIKGLTEPTDPIVFPFEPRLAYSFSGTTVLFARRDGSGALLDDPDDPRDDPGVARILIRMAPSFDPSAKILSEFRFN